MSMTTNPPSSTRASVNTTGTDTVTGTHSDPACLQRTASRSGLTLICRPLPAGLRAHEMGVRPDGQRSQHHRWWRQNQITSLKTGDSRPPAYAIPPNAYAGLPLKGSDASDHPRGPRAEPHQPRPHVDKDLQEAQTAAIERVLEEIEAARERLADGSYGTCKSCRSSIPSSASRSCRTCASALGASSASGEHAGSAPAFGSSYALASTGGDPAVTHRLSAVDNHQLTPAELAVLRASRTACVPTPGAYCARCQLSSSCDDERTAQSGAVRPPGHGAGSARDRRSRTHAAEIDHDRRSVDEIREMVADLLRHDCAHMSSTRSTEDHCWPVMVP
jgi:RNA polymerase-binding transcription factor DksA